MAFALHRAVALGADGAPQLAKIVEAVYLDFAGLDAAYNGYEPAGHNGEMPDIRSTWAGVAAQTMIAAVEANDLKFLRVLWSADMIVDPGAFYPLHGGSVLNAAIHCRHVELVEEMIARGAEVTDYAIMHCIECADLTYIRNAYGLRPSNPKTWRAVFEALLPHCDLNLAEPEFARPLHWAASLGSVEMVTALLAGGANPLLRSGDNLLPRDLVPVGPKFRRLRDILVAAEVEARKDPEMLAESLTEAPEFSDPAKRLFLFDRVSRAHLGFMVDEDGGGEIELYVDRAGKAVVVDTARVLEIATAEGVPCWDNGRVPARYDAITREHSFDLKIPRRLADQIWRGHLICALDSVSPEESERWGAIYKELQALVAKRLPDVLSGDTEWPS
jgi:hypothetical protein